MCSLLHPLWILCFLTLRCALAPVPHWSGSVPLPVNREAHWWASWCFCGYMLSLVSSENEIGDLLHYSVVSCFINFKNVWVEHTNQNFMNWFFYSFINLVTQFFQCKVYYKTHNWSWPCSTVAVWCRHHCKCWVQSWLLPSRCSSCRCIWESSGRWPECVGPGPACGDLGGVPSPRLFWLSGEWTRWWKISLYISPSLWV